MHILVFDKDAIAPIAYEKHKSAASALEEKV